MSNTFTYEEYANEDAEDMTTFTVEYDTFEELIDGLDENGHPGIFPKAANEPEVYDAYAECHYGYPDSEDELDRLVTDADENYVGRITDVEAYAEDFVRGNYDVSPALDYYIDYEKLGRDLLEEYSNHDDHYFYQH